MQSDAEKCLRVLGDFKGKWHLSRDIRPEFGPSAQFEGQAIWTPDAGGLAYAEHGTLTITGAAPMHAERRYHWGPDLSVYFEDGRFFHQVPAAGGHTEHWCDPDHYKVAYDFSNWPRFVVTWKVNGPRKAYGMISRFTPLDAP